MTPARLGQPTRVALGIAIVLVAAGGRLAMPAAAASKDAVVQAAPAPAPPAPSASAPTPLPSGTPSPTSTPSPLATESSPTYTPSTSRYATHTPVVTATPTPTRRATSSGSASGSSSYSGYSTTTTSSGDPRSIAQAMLAARGWGNQFSCLDPLWERESGWSTTAGNASGAYGIPQALPGSKMASAGSDWQTSARTQIAWGLSYIASTYGSPCAAWSHSQSTGWY